MPRELSDDEVRERFLRHVWTMIDYWDAEDRAPTAREKLSGFAHSLLSAIDGSAMALPAFALAPEPHSDDKAYCKSTGNNWYPSAGNVPHDIAGCLRELLYQFDPMRASAQKNSPPLAQRAKPAAGQTRTENIDRPRINETPMPGQVPASGTTRKR